MPSFLVSVILVPIRKLGNLEADMDREEILSQSRKDNLLLDERDRRIADQASTWGAIGMGAVLVVVFFIRMAIKGGEPYDLLAIEFGYLAAANAYRWSATRERKSLLIAIMYAVLSLGWLWFYATGD